MADRKTVGLRKPGTMRRSEGKQLSSLPKRKAEFIEPMDCAPVSKLPDGSQWLFEIKLDGYHAVKSDRGEGLFWRRLDRDGESCDQQLEFVI